MQFNSFHGRESNLGPRARYSNNRLSVRYSLHTTTAIETSISLPGCDDYDSFPSEGQCGLVFVLPNFYRTYGAVWFGCSPKSSAKEEDELPEPSRFSVLGPQS
ncbi:hypothetical protein CHS0354_038645 [Potamilus streckersoni]|uniref:Uncharacterized protein n=1 Tax=Potamilus streckersoni TaxID=2493646 RepID=A0AAE0T864_9BIVA|nr:hypothetical protein CHS0354_038645 [Potamilus streckersoni]